MVEIDCGPQIGYRAEPRKVVIIQRSGEAEDVGPGQAFLPSLLGFRPHQNLTQLATKMALIKGDSSRHQTLLGVTPLGGSPYTTSQAQ